VPTDRDEMRGRREYERGVELMQSGDHAAALSYLRLSTTLEPYEVAYLTKFAKCLIALARYADAEKALRRVCELDPDDGDNWWWLGDSLHSLGRFAEAEPAYRKACELDPDDGDNWWGLGESLHSLGRFAEAEPAYRKACELKPQDDNNWFWLGHSLHSLGRFAEAEPAFRKACELKPQDGNKWNWLGHSLHSLGRFAEAEPAYRKACELKPQDDNNWFWLGHSLHSLGRFAEAEPAFRKACELKPDNGRDWGWLGRSLYSLGRFAEAVDAFRSACRLSPDDANERLWLARSLQERSESVHGHLSDHDLQVPSRSEWYHFNYSQKSCLEAVGRAQSLLASGNARDDINGRLGTNAEEVLAVACNSIGCDPDFRGSSTGFPVIQVHPSVLNYLGLNPDDFGGIEFAMTLGSYLDSQLGIVPVIFAGTRYRRRTRVVALIWSLVKAGDPALTHQREDFAAMARSLIDDGGDQGGLVEMSKLAIMVQRPQGGVDAMTGPFFVPLKLWRYLSMSVFSNARGASASKFSPPWPYPLQLSGSSQSDNLFASPGASRFLQWY